jgi:hypothetical protein
MKLIHLLSNASHSLHDRIRHALARFVAAPIPTPVIGYDHGIDPP